MINSAEPASVRRLNELYSRVIGWTAVGPGWCTVDTVGVSQVKSISA